MKSALVVTSIPLVTGAACALATAAFASPAGHGGEAVHWGYRGDVGPAAWGDLSPAFAACKTGHNQSPIDVVQAAATKTLDPIAFTYRPTALRVVNNGHAIQVNVDPGSSIRIGRTTYNLLQFHFHSPSENRVQGRAFPLEAHLVHASDRGRLAVVAVLFEHGAENALVGRTWEVMPEQPGGEERLGEGTVHLADLLPAPPERTYYYLTGSLTTPPCTEGVSWFVMTEPLEISPAQTERFLSIVGENARPPQPLNHRVVMQSTRGNH